MNRTGNSETWTFNWNGFDKPRWLGCTKGSGTVGNAYLYGADHMRKIGLDFDSVSSGTPLHYSDKTLYVAGGEMEVDYNNSTVSGSGENWNLKTVRVYIPAPDGRAGCAELDPNATSSYTDPSGYEVTGIYQEWDEFYRQMDKFKSFLHFTGEKAKETAKSVAAGTSDFVVGTVTYPGPFIFRISRTNKLIDSNF